MACKKKSYFIILLLYFYCVTDIIWMIRVYFMFFYVILPLKSWWNAIIAFSHINASLWTLWARTLMLSKDTMCYTTHATWQITQKFTVQYKMGTEGEYVMWKGQRHTEVLKLQEVGGFVHSNFPSVVEVPPLIIKATLNSSSPNSSNLCQ